MDRRWIQSGKPFTDSYLDGIKEFVSFVKERNSDDSVVLCPCTKCLNQKRIHVSQLKRHLLMHKFSSTYLLWTHHGEPGDAMIIVDEHNDDNDGNGGHEDDNDGNGGHMDVDDEGEADGEADEFEALLRDGTRHGHEGTEADQGEGGGDEAFAYLLEESKRPLYPGKKHVGMFAFVMRLLHQKSYYRMSNTAFDAWMKSFANALPDGNTLPTSYREAKAYLKELGLSYDSIHVCPNNCILFRKENVKRDTCHKCGASRWKYPDRKKCPMKVLRHFPLVPRLKRLFSSRKTAENMRWHQLVRKPIEGVLSHPADGGAWKAFDDDFPDFALDPRNIRLGLASDGFNPYGTMSTSYSMWPVFAVPYNHSPQECIDPSYYMLCLIIPGKSSPGKDFDLFIEPLLDDLHLLWKGVRAFDAFDKSLFNLHAAVLWCIHDYPACSTMSGRTTQGYVACLHCDKDALSYSIRNKLCYIGHHRFLPGEDPLRRKTDLTKVHKSQQKPESFTAAELQAELEKVRDIKPGVGGDSHRPKRKRGDPSPIWKRRSGLWDLPYWPKLKLRHNLDVMHIEKNIFDNILGTLLELDGKNKDTLNARFDLEKLEIRNSLQPKQQDEEGKIW